MSLIDLYPTLLDMCALPAKQDLDGQSLRPQLREPACQTEPVVITFDQGNYCVRSERWRLIHYKDGSEELYDHRADPHEWHNLIADTRYEQIRLNLAKRLPGAAVEPLGR